MSCLASRTRRMPVACACALTEIRPALNPVITNRHQLLSSLALPWPRLPIGRHPKRALPNLPFGTRTASKRRVHTQPHNVVGEALGPLFQTPATVLETAFETHLPPAAPSTACLPGPFQAAGAAYVSQRRKQPFSCCASYLPQQVDSEVWRCLSTFVGMVVVVQCPTHCLLLLVAVGGGPPSLEVAV